MISRLNMSVFAASFFLFGCGLLDKVETKRQESPMVQDVAFQARDGDFLKKKLLVLPFLDSDVQRSQNVTEVARRAVVDDLVDSKHFIVINNTDVGQDLRSFVKKKHVGRYVFTILALDVMTQYLMYYAENTPPHEQVVEVSGKTK